MAGTVSQVSLGIEGFSFPDLFEPLRLKKLYQVFWDQTEALSPGLQDRFLQSQNLKAPQESEVLIEVARHLGTFLEKLFQVTQEADLVRTQTEALSPVFRFKNEVLKVRVFKRFEEAPWPQAEFEKLDKRVQEILKRASLPAPDAETAFAHAALFFYDCQKKLKKEPLTEAEKQRADMLCQGMLGTPEEKTASALADFENWCVQQYVDPGRRQKLRDWVSYVRPGKLEFENLVPTEMGVLGCAEHRVVNHYLYARDGFKLTDSRMSSKQVLREIDYCMYCHQREKDSCSKGFVEKDSTYKKNPLGIELKGCPLDERISEMQFLRKEGNLLAALAMIVLDNPMCPGTGHRICNDCMKGCIFQKQDPVNIPENETGILTEALKLPYGFEIYSLLTRFNPLNRHRPYALPYNGIDILIVGLGPSGYTLAHYLSNDGFGVVGIDGLKLEPLDETLTGKNGTSPQPIREYQDRIQQLDERILLGFGGVSEYGITVRWDKNFLAAIYLTLLRRQNLRFYGGVRFGGTLTLEDAWQLGFQHVALATGAGRPTLIPMKNNLSRGVRKASDFLMSLQLTGAFKKSSLSNLQVRLPAVVIGGGLTALDTATETLAYYPVHVEKIHTQFEKLKIELGEAAVWKLCNEEETLLLREYLEHAKALAEERQAARRENRKPSFIALCRSWGGVQVAYRKRLQDSPAYRLNHEEVKKALEEGIGFIENVVPLEVEKDRYGAAQALLCRKADGSTWHVPARSIAVAAGTQPNTIYEKEFPGTFELDSAKRYFKGYRLEKTAGEWKKSEASPLDPGSFFLSYENKGRFVSYYGDNHPRYTGNVVKAMASAKHGAPLVASLFEDAIQRAASKPIPVDTFRRLTEKLDKALVATIVEVNRLTPTIVEVIVRAPYAAAKFQPGQFYRLQNYETGARKIDGFSLTMEGLALTGAWVDKEKDLLSLVVLEMGTSSKLCALLKPQEKVVVMGPTGTPTEIAKNETVLLAGGGLGNAVLLSISAALRENGCRVVYFAGYRKAEDLFMRDRLEAATDQVIWAVDSGALIPCRRPQDRAYQGNIVQAMAAYAKGELSGPPLIRFSDVDRVIAIGSDRMMAAVTAARHGILKDFLKPGHTALGSINSPMQCMMKEICAQCLQRHVDPITGAESFVFSCLNQDQPLDTVDFSGLNDRLRVNSLSEKLSDSLIQRLFKTAEVKRK